MYGLLLALEAGVAKTSYVDYVAVVEGNKHGEDTRGRVYRQLEQRQRYESLLPELSSGQCAGREGNNNNYYYYFIIIVVIIVILLFTQSLFYLFLIYLCCDSHFF